MFIISSYIYAQNAPIKNHSSWLTDQLIKIIGLNFCESVGIEQGLNNIIKKNKKK